jgi:hypothetical protein
MFGEKFIELPGRMPDYAETVFLCDSGGGALAIFYKSDDAMDWLFNINRLPVGSSITVLEVVHTPPASALAAYSLGRIEGRPEGLPFSFLEARQRAVAVQVPPLAVCTS